MYDLSHSHLKHSRTPVISYFPLIVVPYPYLSSFVYFFDTVATVVYVLIHPLGAIPVTIFMPAITIMLAKTHPHSTVNGP